MMKAANLNDLWAQCWVEELVRQGISHFVCSPGSRSTPLTVAAARHPQTEVSLFHDERAAAFCALGVARATGTPAPLICTSGTAMANYFPALIEASVDHVPMLVCSADRPPELWQTGANQTIQQPGLYGDYVRWSFAFPCPEEQFPLTALLTAAAQAVYKAKYGPAGPVHINFSFRKPLEPTPQAWPQALLKPLETWQASGKPYTTYLPPTTQGADLSQAIAKLKATSRGLLAIGRLPAHTPKAGIITLANTLRWPTLIDIGANIDATELHTHVESFDWVLASEEARSTLRPECILHIGGPLLSKCFGLLCQEHLDCPYLLLQEHDERIDPFHQVSTRIVGPLSGLSKQLSEALEPGEASWLQKWQMLGQRAESVHREVIDGTEDTWTEATMARILAQQLPAEHAFFIGNSMPIRYMERVGTSLSQVTGINRGASGIEGLVACAIGFVTGAKRPGTIYLGDVSMLHDLNSLSQLKRSGQALVVIIANNDGGGIFRILPIAKDDFQDVFPKMFQTPHQTNFQAVSTALGVPGVRVSTRRDFLDAYKQGLSQEGPFVIEACFDAASDHTWNLAYQDKIKRHIAKTLEEHGEH